MPLPLVGLLKGALVAGKVAAKGAVKGAVTGAKVGAKKIGKSAAGKLLGREKRIMMGQPHPKAEIGASKPGIQPQQSLTPDTPGIVPSVPESESEGQKNFATEKEAALQIKTTTIQVATLLKGSYVLDKERQKDKRKILEQEKRGKAEKGLEKGKPKGSNLKIKIPGKGLLDKMFGFLGEFLLFGITMKLLDWLPTIQKILPILARVADWFIEAGIWIVDALAGVIDFGYKLVDKMEGWVKNVFGEEGAEKFTTFMTNLKNLFVGFLLWKIIGKKILTAVIKNIKFAFNLVKGIVGKFGRFINFLSGGTIGRGLQTLGRGIGNIAGRVAGRFMGTGAGRLGGSLMKKGVGGLLKRGALKLFGKTFVKAASKLFGRVPIIGPLIVGIVSLISGEPLGQAVFKVFGAAIGELLGTFIPIPVVGTLLGGTIGMFVGDVLYHLIIKKDPKKAMEMLRDAIMNIFKAGEFLFNFVKDGVTNVIDNFPTVPIPDFRPGDIIAKIMMKIPGGLDILGLEVPGWVPGIGGASVIGALQGLPGLQEVMGFFAQFIPGMGKYIKSGRLLAIPNLAMLTPLGLPFLTPLIAKSFLPGIFGEPTPPPAVGEAPKAPEKISAASIRAESQRRKEEAERKQLEAMKKMVGNVTGAVGGFFNRINPFGGGDKDKDKDSLRDNVLTEINDMDVGTAREIINLQKKKMEVGRAALREKDPAKKEALKLEQNALSMKIRKLYGNESTDASGNVLDYTKGGSTYETKLKTANEQGGAKAVIESISTSASYEEGSPEVITLPTPPPKKEKSISQVQSQSAGALISQGSGGGSNPYESLYKGG